MSKTLEDRLRSAELTLDQAHAAMGRHTSKLSVEVDEGFRRVIQFRSDIDHWIGLLGARAAALQLLRDLEATVDQDGYVVLGASRVKFHHARLIGVQSYLTTSWALADRITGMVGRVVCPPSAGCDPTNPAQLVSHFVRSEKGKAPAAVLSKSIRFMFGWPIAISYAIRNHVVHDGAQFDGVDFFEGAMPSAGFRISADGWRRIEARALEYGVAASLHRAGPLWPPTPCDDLRLVLDVCEREMDDALGVLVGSATAALLSHVRCMVGED